MLLVKARGIARAPVILRVALTGLVIPQVFGMALDCDRVRARSPSLNGHMGHPRVVPRVLSLPMVRPTGRRAVYADVEALPPHITGQIIDGELFTHARPSLEHSETASVLGMDLGGPFDRGRGGPGGWWIRDEPELHFGADVLVPDLAGWRRDRVATPPSGPFMTIAPQWLAEVLSPSTAGIDRVRKLPVYLREGVEHVWLLDPIARTLEVLRRVDDAWTLAGTYGDVQLVRAEPFGAIELDLSALWAPR